MKIAITGHSRGLGKEIYDRLLVSHDILGFSRSNGFDINKPIDILKYTDDRDVFINNAYDGIAQSNLFIKLFDLWFDKNKTIININSSSIHQSGAWNPLYTSNKKHLHNVTQSVIDKFPNKKVRIINLNIGTLDSHKGFEEFNKIKGEQIVHTINWCINLPQEIEIQQLTIVPTSIKKSTFL